MTSIRQYVYDRNPRGEPLDCRVFEVEARVEALVERINELEERLEFHRSNPYHEDSEYS